MRAALDLGPDVIQRLLPHRRPMLMVDRVVDFVDEPPTVRALRHVSGNDAVFDGHFPGLALWPGVLTIEGLAQTCNLLFVLRALDAEVLDALKRFELSPLDPKRELPGMPSPTTIAMTTAIDVKLTHPVFGGQRIDYRATHLRDVAGMSQCEVEATVAGRVVARGTITAALAR